MSLSVRDVQQPAWLAEAWRELGQREISGSAANARITALFRDAGHAGVTSDETAWCAAFVGACLARAAIRPSGSLLARSYLSWGEESATPELGAVTVLSRSADPSLGHVGFLVGATDASVLLLGGNQADSVSVAAFPWERVRGFRAPSATASAGDVTARAIESGFATALAHVLTQEGGWSDDPHDPGGPTNQGITLATFARFIGQDVTAATLGPLKDRLRAIPGETVEAIYRRDYWLPSRAAELPDGLRLMHFDAAVNHGVGGAARLLQEALAVTIDGEIGPETLGAARASATPGIIRRYADLRRRRYRALPHFWRFGRGWLSRVDATLAQALAAAASQPIPRKQQKESPDMPAASNDLPPSSAEVPSAKWWGSSMTIWGAAITALSTVLPVVGPLIGLDITSELIRQIGADIVNVAQAVGGLTGTLMTVYGRMRASAPLTRRPVSLKV